MIRLFLAVIVLCLAIMTTSAVVGAEEEQEPGWKNELVFNLNLTQASFDNWSQGGENTLGWQAGFNGKFTHFGDRHEWGNTAKLAYGMQKVGDEEARKSVDEIVLETVYSYKPGFPVDFYAAATARTQFSNGFEYEDSRTRSSLVKSLPIQLACIMEGGIRMVRLIRGR